MGSLLDAMNLYSSDVFAQSTLLVDYLKGLTYLHDQKGIMHRDVSPKNLGVLSFDPPRGILLDLDSATREEKSIDHMQGTMPYLAPEIIELKKQEEPSASPTQEPVPYSKGVDVWALGLSVFAFYVGHDFTWGPYNARRVPRRIDKSVNFVEAESHNNFKRHLQAKRVSAGDDQAKFLLGLVNYMTEWNPASRIQANEALDIVQDMISNQRSGSIKRKAAPKRLFGDST